MAETTNIAWADATFNPWIGCTKVGPGCDHCYAEQLDRMRFSHTLGGGTAAVPIVHWGAGAPRHRTAPANWRKPILWDREAHESGKPRRVFCASLADVFDNDVPDDWRSDLWGLVDDTPNLTWMLLTKRIGNVMSMLPVGWIGTHSGRGIPRNVWLGATVVNQDEVRRDVAKLLDVPARIRFLSCEPLLQPLDIRGPLATGAVHWVIVGGESGHHARGFNVAWARSIVRQCRRAGVPVFVKQMGSFVVDRNDAGFDGCEATAWPDEPEVEHDIYGFTEHHQGADVRVRLRDRAGADPAEWPEDLRVQEFPK